MAEAEVGEVDSVDRAVVFHAIHSHALDIIDVLVAVGHEAVEIARQGGVLGRQILAEMRVVAGVGIYRTLHQHDGRVGMGVGQYLHKIIGERVAHHLGAVRHRVEQEHVDVWNTAHGPRHAEIHLSLARESEVDNLGVELAAEDVGRGHASARGAAALHDAGAVGHDLAPRVNYVGASRGDGRAGIDLYVQLLHAVIQRQVDHVLVHLAVEPLDILRINGLVLLVLEIWAVGVDVTPHRVALEGVEVGPFQACVGHVYHVRVPQQAVVDADAFRVGGETHGDAARALRAVPQVGAHAVLKPCGDAGVGAGCVVPSLVDYAQFLRVDKLPRLFVGRRELCGPRQGKNHQ